MPVPSDRFRVPIAVHLFLVRGGRVLLLRRANTGYQDGNYSVIAGHLDGGESVLDAMVREAREEAGIAVLPEDLSPAGVMHCRDDDEYVHFFFACSRWSGEVLNREPGKCDDIAWFPLGALPGNMVPYVHRALQNYLAGVRFDLFGWGGAAQGATSDGPVKP